MSGQLLAVIARDVCWGVDLSWGGLFCFFGGDEETAMEGGGRWRAGPPSLSCIRSFV